jgi:hypothetical protein
MDLAGDEHTAEPEAIGYDAVENAIERERLARLTRALERLTPIKRAVLDRCSSLYRRAETSLWYAPMKRILFTLLAAAAAACGGSNAATNEPATPATTTGSAEHKEGSGKHDHHKDLPPALHDFHGVLAPVWHSDPGATRVEKACSNQKALSEKAAATNDAALIAAVKDLEPACASAGRPDVETKLTVVHERFHAVAKIEKHDEKHEEKH